MVLLRNDAFRRNPLLRRMPHDDAQWLQFIRELNNQEIGDVKEFTPTWGGFSSDPGGAISYIPLGTFCIVFTEQALTGTSDATTFTLTGFPDEISPATNRFCFVGAIDNGTTTFARVSILPSTNTMSFGVADSSGSILTFNGSGWTASGNKGITQGSQIVYSLKDET